MDQPALARVQEGPGEMLRGGGGARPQRGPAAKRTSVLEFSPVDVARLAVWLPGEAEDRGVVDQTVDGCDRVRLGRKEVLPVLEAGVRCHEGGLHSMAARDEPEQAIGLVDRKRHISEFIKTEEIGLLVLAKDLGVAAVDESCVQFVEV